MRNLFPNHTIGAMLGSSTSLFMELAIYVTPVVELFIRTFILAIAGILAQRLANRIFAKKDKKNAN